MTELNFHDFNDLKFWSQYESHGKKQNKTKKKTTSIKESVFTNFFNMASADCHTGINGYKKMSPRTSSGIYICRTLIFSVFICFMKF